MYDTTIRGTLIEFKNSIFNPHFYKEVGDKELQHVYDYIYRMCLVFGFVEFVYLAVTSFQWVFANKPTINFIVLFAMTNIIALIIIYLYLLISWIILGWAVGGVLFILSSFIKKTSLIVSAQQGLHAAGISVIFILFYKEWQPSLWIIFGLPVLVLILNLIPYKKLKLK